MTKHAVPYIFIYSIGFSTNKTRKCEEQHVIQGIHSDKEKVTCPHYNL